MHPRTYLHIGLHKTGTRFLQRNAFRALAGTRFLYNPDGLTEALNAALKHPEQPTHRERAHAEFDRARAEASARGLDLLISKPGLSGDMYDGHGDYRARLALVQAVIPRARIVLFIRNQSDWLLSAYRQSLQKGVPGPIEHFLNFNDGVFQSKTSPRVNGMRNVDPLRLQFLALYEAWAHAYGEDAVWLFRYEDMRRHRAHFLDAFAQALDLERAEPAWLERVHNRSISALAICVFFGGVYAQRGARPVGGPSGPPAAPLVQMGRRVRRLFARHVFDTLIYRDWDILGMYDMRAKIDAHYAAENATLARLAASNPAAAGASDAGSDSGDTPVEPQAATGTER